MTTAATSSQIAGESGSTRLPSRAEEYRGGKAYRRRWQQLDRLAQPMFPIWRAVNEFMHPWSGKYLFSEKELAETVTCANIKNSAVMDAVRICAAGLHGGLTSPARPWFEVTHPDSRMMEVKPVKQWLNAVQEIMLSVLAKSNFYAVTPNLYREAILYSPAAMIIDKDIETGVRFYALTCGEYRLGLGADLRVNTLYRRLEMTAGQMRDKFGKDNPGYSEAVRNAIRNGNLDDPVFSIIHAMQPWGYFGNAPHRLFRYESVYFMMDSEDPESQTVLLRLGHRTMPFVAVRWETTSNSVYGFSPAMMALPDDRMLQVMEGDYINAVEKSLHPPIVGPSELETKMREGGLEPGEFIPVQAGGNMELRSVYDMNFDFNNTRAKIQETVQQIQGKFYNQLFLSILFNTKQMTATEIAQRMEEKAMVLGPVLERFQSELFDPILDRVFAIMQYEHGVIPPPPEDIFGSDLKIEYIGTLAQTVRMLGITNITNSLPVIGEMLKIDPAAAIKMDIKEGIDYVALKSNYPPNLIRTDEECEKIEQQQAEAQAKAAGAGQIMALANAAKTASETSLENGSLLTGTQGGMGGANNGLA